MLCKSIDCFLHNGDLCHERGQLLLQLQNQNLVQRWCILNYLKCWSIFGHFRDLLGCVFFIIYSSFSNSFKFYALNAQLNVIFHATKYVTLLIWSTFWNLLSLKFSIKKWHIMFSLIWSITRSKGNQVRKFGVNKVARKKFGTF